MRKKAKQSQNLNAGEQLEIKEDVKDAIGKALKHKKTSIDKTLSQGTSNTLDQKEIDKIIKSQNNKTDKRPIIVTIVLTLLIALTGIFMYYSNNPKTIFIKVIDKTFNNIEKNIIPKYEKNKGNLTMNLELSENDKQITNLQTKTNYSIDTKSNILIADTKVETSDNTIINSQIYKEEKNTYLYLGNILDKYIKLENNIPSNDQTKTILNSINKALNKGIEKEKIIGATTKIEINKKNTKTYKSTLTLNKENYDVILDTINKSLKENQKFINAVADIKNQNESKVKEELNKKINQAKNDFSRGDNITINIYTKGATQKFIKLEIIKTKNSEVTTLNLTNIDGQYTYLINNQAKNEIISGNIEYTKAKNNLNMKLDINKNQTKLKINLNNHYQKTNKIKKVDITNNIDFSELTNDQQKNIILGQGIK